MRRSAIASSALIALAVLTGTALAGAPEATRPEPVRPETARAGVEKTFLIPASEGYGVGECLTNAGSPCGQVVADAWCEAQGFSVAGSFGIAAQDEYTGAIETAAPAAERPIRITCQD